MTETIDAFHAAVFADLADPLPRRVYADWLDDQGEAEYAELIRLRADRSRRPRGRKPAERSTRQTELYRSLLQHWRVEELFPGTGRLPLVHGVLPDRLQVAASELRRSDMWPVYLRPRQLAVRMFAGDADGLGWHRGLQSVTQLDLNAAAGPYPRPAGPVLAAVAGSPYLPALQYLRLHDFTPTPADLTAFADGPVAGRLWGFHLSYPDGTDEEDEWGHQWPRYHQVSASGDVPGELRAAATGLPPPG